MFEQVVIKIFEACGITPCLAFSVANRVKNCNFTITKVGNTDLDDRTIITCDIGSEYS